MTIVFVYGGIVIVGFCSQQKHKEVKKEIIDKKNITVKPLYGRYLMENIVSKFSQSSTMYTDVFLANI